MRSHNSHRLQNRLISANKEVKHLSSISEVKNDSNSKESSKMLITSIPSLAKNEGEDKIAAKKKKKIQSYKQD